MAIRIAAILAMLCLGAAAPSSAERKAVLDALRPAVEAKVGPNVEFVVALLRVEEGWAFVIALGPLGTPRASTGCWQPPSASPSSARGIAGNHG